MTKEQNLEKHLHKHMGCMSGFLHIFDRHHCLPGKRIYAAKSLPPVADTSSEISAPPSPESEISALPLRASEEGNGSSSSWRLRKDAPRLSLDSRATTDAKGSLHPKQIRPDDSDGAPRHPSPSVIARLMGLEPLLPPQPEKMPELRRSASESRVSKDLFRSRFGAVFNPPPAPVEEVVRSPDPRNISPKTHHPKGEAREGSSRGAGNSSAPQWRAPPQRKSFFDSRDMFPEPRQTVTIYGEIEDRIRTRGGSIQPSQDLEALKQVLEALQLKGLLRSKPPSHRNQIRHRNFVYDESPAVFVQPSRSRDPAPINRRIRNDYSPANGSRGGRREFGGAREIPPSIVHRRERTPTTRLDSLAKPKALGVGTQMRTNESRKASPIKSPKLNVSNRSARNRKPTSEIHRKENVSNVVVLEDVSSSSSSSTASTDIERPKLDGINLTQRCDKLLHSTTRIPATDAQPSPVSVLDSSFYKDESSTPSPAPTKRNIDFKDQSGELEEDIWSPRVSPIRSKQIEPSDDSDFSYISDILRAIHYLPKTSDVFQLLESQQYLKQTDASQFTRLNRKLIFDTVDEILDRNRRLPPWEAVAPSPDKIWSEIERIREHYSGDDLLESVRSVLRRDMTGDSVTSWGDCAVEMSEVVLDMERLIFKDLVCDSIGDLGALASVVPKRKLVF